MELKIFIPAANKNYRLATQGIVKKGFQFYTNRASRTRKLNSKLKAVKVISIPVFKSKKQYQLWIHKCVAEELGFRYLKDVEQRHYEAPEFEKLITTY